MLLVTASRIILVLLFLSVLLPRGFTFNSQSGSFPDNSQLTCFVPGPNGESIPESTRRVSFQPGPRGTVWLPQESGFQRPGIEPLDTVALTRFLLDELSMAEVLFISFTRPRVEAPPLAVNDIPVEGSGGRFDSLFVPDPPPLPNLETVEPDLRAPILSFIQQFSLGRCDLTSNWTKLPDTFFPSYYAGSKCDNENRVPSCSFPEGMQCEPNISEGRVAYVSVLRWDCCWSFEDGEWKWRCGWRRVEIPIVVDCICGCQALNAGPLP